MNLPRSFDRISHRVWPAVTTHLKKQRFPPTAAVNVRICVQMFMTTSEKSIKRSVDFFALSLWLGTTFESEGRGTGREIRLLESQVNMPASGHKREVVGG